ncbi:MAG: methylcobamide--CoM methyltransferase [Armatimonadetes bacterium]|nr:methylcobamide--CoM methyltransferase [Armatimonadota bacterium]
MISTVVGSYPKIADLPAPGKWRSGVERLQRGQITAEEMRKIEEEVTLEAIQDQVAAGVDVITDGQIRWEDGQTYFARRLTGFSLNGLERYFDTNVYYRAPVCQGEVGWTAPITVADYQFARAHATRPLKAVVTGPYTIARLSKNSFYPNLGALVMALARALNQEIRALEAAGAPIIQVDEPAAASELKRYLAADRTLFFEAMAAVTEGVKATLALYTYFGDVGHIYPEILSLPFQVIGLDVVAGAKNWEVIAQAPFTRELGLGVLDARNTRMESPAEIAAAVARACRVVSPEKLHVSPSAGLEFLPRGVARRKLDALVSGVRQARESLEVSR